MSYPTQLHPRVRAGRGARNGARRAGAALRQQRRPAPAAAVLALATVLALLFSLFPQLAGVEMNSASAHNLQTKMAYMFLDQATQTLLDNRIAGGWTPGTPILQTGDQVGIITKVIPRFGTNTGVGGHVDFYVPDGVTVVDAGYMVPDGAGGFIKTAMKGQSPIAVGDGPIGAKSTSQLIDPPDWNGYTNVNGVTQQPVVPTTGLHRGTIAGVYGDTGIFYSTNPDTAYGSWQKFTGDWNAGGANKCGSLAFTAANGKTLVNNSGDTVVPCNKWDAGQLMAWSAKGGTYGVTAPIVDYSDGRGNAPWGFASGVAGPQSGYAWNFDWNQWNASAKTAADMRAAMANTKLGPWNRVKYQGSRVSFDQPGLVSTVLGYASKDASNLGAAFPLPATTSQTDTTSPKALRWAVGQLTLERPEYVWVKIQVDNPNGSFLNASGCPVFHSDTFGGDAGGTDNGKDHLWRYYEPTEFQWNGCLAAGKPATAEFVKVGDTIQYKIKIYNLGTQTQTNVVVKDTLPSGVSFLSAVPAQNSGPNPLVWNVGTLQPGQAFSATVSVKITGTGPLDNQLDVTSNQGSQSVTETTESGNTVFLVPTKTVSPTTVAPGGTVTYDLLVKNLGGATTGSPLTLQEFLPAGFTYQSLGPVTVNGAAVTGTTVNSTNPNQPVFTVPMAIQGGKDLTLRFTALVGGTVAAGNYCNTYSVTQNSIPITTGSQGCVDVGAGTIGDTVFRDWDGNGTQDAVDEGIPGVTVNLYAGNCPPSGSPVQTKTTDASGKYLFGGLNTPATYCVDAVGPAGYTATTPDPKQITLAQNETNLTADFGYKPGGTAKIGDLVFDDQNNDGVFDATDVGIPGVTLTLYEDTNGNGVVDAGADAQIATTVTGACPGANCGIYQFTGLDPALSYVVVATDGAGSPVDTYFANPYVSSTGNPQTVKPADFTAQANNVTDADFGYFGQTPGSIGDQVFIDANGNGVFDAGEQTLPNITVNLYQDLNGNGIIDLCGAATYCEPLIATASTSVTGTYTFPNLGPGNYVALVDETDPDIPPGYSSTINPIPATLAAGQHRTDVDFPFVQLISKTVTPANATPGSTLTYTIVTNYPGPDLLSEAIVTDTIPSGTTYLAGSVSGNGVYSPTINSVSWELGSNLPAVPGLTASSGKALCPVSANLPVTADTFIDKSNATRNYGGNTLLITRPANANSLKYALVKFDVSSIPAGAVIQSATLGMNVQSARSSNHVDQVYRLLTSWTEGTLTGNNCSVGASWNAPNCTDAWAGGGAFSTSDYDGNVLGSMSPKTKGYKTAIVTAAVNAWVNGGKANHGLVLVSTGTDGGDAKYYNRENTTANTDPYLKVIYYVETAGGCSGPTTLNPSADGYVNSDKPTENYGITTELFTRPTGQIRHGLVQFDLATIPADATVSSATLNVVVTTNRSNHVDEVRAASTAWTEGTGNGNVTNDGASWSDPNGSAAGDWRSTGTNFGSSDYGATVYDTITPSTNGAKTATVTAAVQSWLTGAIPNYGFVLLSTGTDNGDAKYGAREHGTAANRPTLTVNWTLAANPAGQTAVRLHATPLLLGQAGQIKVTMQVTATQNIATLTPPANLTISTDGPACALGAGPTPATAALTAGTPVYFTYVYNCVPAADPGIVQFSGKPSASGIQFATGFSEGVIVTPSLSFQVTVDNPQTVAVVNNTAILEDSGAMGQGVPSNPTNTSLSGSIGDRVWADLNGDGVQDAGEPGLANVQVCATPTGGGAATCATTDANGNYRIYGLTVNGTYNVALTPATVPSGYTQTYAPPQPRTATAAGDNNADFGLQPPGTAKIGDLVWLDADNSGGLNGTEQGLPGVTVRLYKDVNNNGSIDGGDVLIGTQATDANGNYLFTGLQTANYLVQVDTSSPVTSPYDGATTIAAAMAPTTGTVNPKAVAITTPGQSVLTADFGYNWSGKIGDTVWWDDNRNQTQDGAEAGIPNAAVLLYFDANGNGILDPALGDYQIGYAPTDANGKYAFNNLPPGKYLVDVYEDSITTNGVRNIVPTTQDVIYKNLAPAETYLAADFGYYVGAKVEGNVFWDENRNATLDGAEQVPSHLLPNVTVDIRCAGTDGLMNTADDVVQSTTTDANGHYAFIVPPSLCTVSYNTTDPDIPAALGDQTTPVSYTFTAVAGEDWHPSFDFGRDNTGKIGDTVWNDPNGNGTQEAGEAGIAGVSARLYHDLDNSNTLTAGDVFLDAQATDANGKYLFVGLADGNYVVVVDGATVPDSFAPTYDNSGAVDGVGQADIVGGNSVLTADFGYKYAPAGGSALYTISGRVYNDQNNNGNDDGEPAFANVDVTVVCDFGTSVVHSDITGAWALTGIPAGSTCTVLDADEADLPATNFVGTETPGVPITVNSNITGLDFGYNQRPSSISGTVCDGSGNGVCSAGEPGIANVPVTLTWAGPDGILGTGDDVTTSTVTNLTGGYTFPNLPPGLYQIVETTPTGYITLADKDGGNPDNITVNLGLAQNLTGQDFEDRLPASVAGTVFEDYDKDGQQDPGEPGIGGVTVTLKDSTGTTTIATTTTDGLGDYSFPNLPAGSYLIVETQPATYLSTGDADGGNPDQIAVTLAAGQSKMDQDFGEVKPGAISGTVFNDANNNGVQDLGENGLPNVTVCVSPTAGISQPCATTDANGHYTVPGVPPGTYTVTETDPAGYVSTTPNSTPVTVPSGGTGTANYGDKLPVAGTHSISGTVCVNGNNNGVCDAGETPLPGVTVKLYDATNTVVATTTTDVNGLYTFPNLPDGTYKVVETDPAGYVSYNDVDLTNDNTIVVPVAGANVTGRDFVDQPLTGKISGTVYEDLNLNGQRDAGEPGIQGVSVALKDSGGTTIATALTDANGYYEFSPVAPGSYTVVETDKAGYISTGDVDGANDNKIAVTLPAGGNITGRDFGDVRPGTLSGTVFNDTNKDGTQQGGEPGIPGVIVCVTPVNGGQTVCTTTDANGNYTFPNLPPGDYVISETDPAGYTSTTPNSAPVTLPSGGTGGVNFGDVPETPGTHTVSGTVCTNVNGNGQCDLPGETGLPGVTVELRDATTNALIDSTTTDANGDYSFPNVPDGTYKIVEIDPANYTSVNDANGGADNTINPVVVNGADVVNQDFIDTPVLGSIAGKVCNDANRNGVCDAGEAGIDGVTVTLYDSNGTPTTTTTSGGGNYQFTNLPPDTYTIKEADPASFVSTGDVYGTNDNTIVKTLPAGGNVTGQNFADAPAPGSINGTVYNDVNGNGQYDPGETGIPGVTVCLTPSSPANCVTTDANGHYSFTNLLPGNYTVTETDPPGYTSTGDVDGAGNGLNTIAVTVPSGGTVSGRDFFDKLPGAPSLVVAKTLTTTAQSVRPGEKVVFNIKLINNGGTTITVLPLSDTYDTIYLTYGYGSDFSTPPSDDNLNDGTINWSDLTVSFGHDMAPNEEWNVSVTFTAKADTSNLPGDQTVNTARTQGVLAGAQQVPDQESAAGVQIFVTTGVNLARLSALANGRGVQLAWETASEAQILGFNVQRKAAGAGDDAWETVNSDPILTQYPGLEQGAGYGFLDEPAPGKYVYRLEVLKLDGSAETYGSVTVMVQP